MNIFKALLYVIPVAGMSAAVACTDVEKLEIDHNGGYNTRFNEESEA